MRAPVGSIVGLCSASATMFAMGMAFLGYWGVHEPHPWRWHEILVVVLALGGFSMLGAVTWIATTPVEDETLERVLPARRAFALGVVLLWLSVLVTVVY
jgi:hypothetical protein